MATRPAFLPHLPRSVPVRVVGVDFQWHAGLVIGQKRRSIKSLHAAIVGSGLARRPLEVSTKSEAALGRALSAFNLAFSARGVEQPVTVESAFQGSKVFAETGPFHQIYRTPPREARAFFRGKDLGDVVRFDFFGEHWPNRPLTLFYNWIYIKTLRMNREAAREVLSFDAFTDVEFNPAKSFNCQAYAVALYVALVRAGMGDVLNSKRSFVAFFSGVTEWRDAYGAVDSRHRQASLL